MSARRAVIRWAWRLFRREWRQQALVLALLTVAVATAIFAASFAYNVTPVPGRAEFGSADHYLRFEASGPAGLRADLDAARATFGTVDVIGHRQVPIPGTVAKLELRSQDPRGAYGGPMLALREGRYPVGAAEVAVTDGVAEMLQLDVGAGMALDGAERTVVGVVENPSDLGANFALLAPGQGDPESVTVLVRASDDQVIPFRAHSGASTTRATAGDLDSEGANAAVGVLGTATMALFLIALVAGASFVVVAQRRLRQLGMLAAIGATEKQLRLVTVANGALIGGLAAVAGAVAGVAAWIGAVPSLEPAVGHRIERFDVPWWLIATGMLLAFVSASVAAWWPARSVARIPVTLALSGRPPAPPAVHRSAALAAALVVVGVACLALADQSSQPLLLAGTVATVFGVLLVGPLALRALAGCAARLPVAARLALRDLARYQARAGAALAAISLVLGISVAVVVTAAAAEHGADEGNLSDRQLLIRTETVVETEGDNIGGPFVPERSPAELERLEANVDRIVAPLDEPVVTGFDVAMDPAVKPDPAVPGRQAVTLAVFVGGERPGWRDVTLLYVATPELLAPHGAELGDADLLTTETGERRLSGVAGGLAPLTGAQRIEARYPSLPGSFITADGLRRRGWEAARAGWLVEAKDPLTTEQLAAARDVAAGAGLTIESRDRQEDLASQRRRASAAGILLALAVLAMTVGLIRGEAAGDLRTLAAAGATASTRRMLTAATAGALALLGVALGTLGAFLGLAAGYLSDLGSLAAAPVLDLALLALGVPLVATAAGWLLAGREPPGLGRHTLE